VIVGSDGAMAAAASPPVEVDEDTVRRTYDEIFCRRNLAFVDEAFSADVVLHSPLQPEPIVGRAAVKEIVGRILAGFSDFDVTVEDVITQGDTSMVRYTMRGTHDGDYFGIPATLSRVEVSEQELVRLEDGKVREVWLVFDVARLLGQLGMLPPLGRIPTPVARLLARRRSRPVRASTARPLAEPALVDALERLREPLPAALRDGFSDLRVFVEQVVVAGDGVGVRATIRGTHGGEFMGVAATGAEIEIPVHEVVRLRGGRIRDVHVAVDLVGVARQLGVMPPPERIPRSLLRLMAWRQRRAVDAGRGGWTSPRRSGIVASEL
jgi:predicted ester cyclase